MADLLGIERRGQNKDSELLNQLKMGNIPSAPIRIQQLLGVAKNNNGDKSSFNKEKWLFLIESPYPISNQCCNVMKKAPLHKYKGYPMTAQMASESVLRTQKWLQNGCNGFEMKRPISNPMSFWTEQDVLLYIKQNNLKICSVYGEIVEDTTGTDEVQGQMTISEVKGFEDMKLFDARSLPLKTTRCNRTGCMFCGYGCHLEKESRFERMKQTHPEIYSWIMKPTEEGGLNYKAVIDWINEHGNLHIKY